MSLLEKKYLNIDYPINLILEIPPWGFNPIDIRDWCLNNEIPEDVIMECRNKLDTWINMRLNDREKHCIKLRYEQHLALARIGETLDITAERTRQIIAKAVRKLRYRSTIIFDLAKHASNDPEDVMKYTIMSEYGFMEYYDDLQNFPCYDRVKWITCFLGGEKPDISWFEKSPKYQKIARIGIVEYTTYIELKITELAIKNASLTGDFSIIKDCGFDDDVLDCIPVESFGLSVRSYNIIKRMGIHKVGDLRKTSKSEIRRARNCGEKSLKEIIGKLEALGIMIPEDYDDAC